MVKKAAQLFSMMLMVVLVITLIGVPGTLAAGSPQQSDKTIVELAVEDGRFTTLVAALQAAELDGTLNGPGPFTVFAPTDDAFATLPAGEVDALLADIPALKNLLLYHVWAGEVPAAEVVKLGAADTLLGPPVRITVDGGPVKLNEAQVIITDIAASNGVIHVIDAVLLPPEAGPAKPGYDRPRPDPMVPGGPDGYQPGQPDQDYGGQPHQDEDPHKVYPPPPHYSPNSSYYIPTPYGYHGPYGGGYGQYHYYDYKGYTRWWHLPRHYH